MTRLEKYYADCNNKERDQWTYRELEELRNFLKHVEKDEITSINDAKNYLELLRLFRLILEQNDSLRGEQYHSFLSSVLSVGEDGLYSNDLRFIFELIQNVDDCEFDSEERNLDVHFDYNHAQIVLTYNERGFSPFNVFAITGIAEAAKNVSNSKVEIGEKGIGFKSAFGVADSVEIRSGWFSFELRKDNFTIPVPKYDESSKYCPGTQMTLHISGNGVEITEQEKLRVYNPSLVNWDRKRSIIATQRIYQQIRDQYCTTDAIFTKNPLLFLNKLTSLKIYFDDKTQFMDFSVSHRARFETQKPQRDENVIISVRLRDSEKNEQTVESSITCASYVYPVVYDREACQSRYGKETTLGSSGGKRMQLQVLLPYPEFVEKVGNGRLYSFLPTQLKLTVPLVCNAPFKLDASREFVDPQDGNLWFKKTSQFLGEIVDFAMTEWAKEITQQIVLYFPPNKKGLFDSNNGKEKCLKQSECFSQEHYSSLPLFFINAGENLKSKNDVVVFKDSQSLVDVDLLAALLKVQDSLFVLPCGFSDASSLGLKVLTNPLERLLENALQDESLTTAALQYLSSVKYEFDPKILAKKESLNITVKQLEIIYNTTPVFAKILTKSACESVKKGTKPLVNLTCSSNLSLSNCLGNTVCLDEAPQNVMSYVNEFALGKCVRVSIPPKKFLPCANIIALSDESTVDSFYEFCDKINPDDMFSLRNRIAEKTKDLERTVDGEGTTKEFMTLLKNLRLLVKDSLGAGYRGYFQGILRTGIDKDRFIQELLQNADDCVFPEDKTPSFVFSSYANQAYAEYNEVGFTRANVRAITAIGESTKKLIRQNQEIGEKGVGFKSVFSVASRVEIQSGEFHFSLSDEAPTVPESLVNSTDEPYEGTKITFSLKERPVFPRDDSSLLRLCLCLRQLKFLMILGHKITIDDSESWRIITIDSNKYKFRKFVHPFEISDQKALVERGGGTRDISSHQQIVCYVSDREQNVYFLYSGLPTRCEINIPMTIDAPFALTTSREFVDPSCDSWNRIIRKETYTAILMVMRELKGKDRTSVLRFVAYRNNKIETFSDEYLNSFDFQSMLLPEKLLATYDPNVFVGPTSFNVFLCPSVLRALFDKAMFGTVKPSSVIKLAETYENTAMALGCKKLSSNVVLGVLANFIDSSMGSDWFRTKLYDYLKILRESISEQLLQQVKQFKIVPVYSEDGSRVKYVSWQDDKIFISKDAFFSTKEYWIMNTGILPKEVCEKILAVNVNVMNETYKKGLYQKNLEKSILQLENNQDALYAYLLNEFRAGNLKMNDAIGVISRYLAVIPLKNRSGKICRGYRCYWYKESSVPCASAPLFQDITAHEECSSFAQYLACRELATVSTDSFSDYKVNLTADDVEALLSGYFLNSVSLIKFFQDKNLIPKELVEKYPALSIYNGNPDSNKEYQFPSQSPNLQTLKLHINRLWSNPVKIVTEMMQRSVKRGKIGNDPSFNLEEKDAREGVTHTYIPSNATEQNVCFCQMCRKVKRISFIETNSVEKEPRYYFPQCRIALCLECSRIFKDFRNTDEIREKFIERIKNTDVGNKGQVEVPLFGDHSILFTGIHLAEMQEILRRSSQK